MTQLARTKIDIRVSGGAVSQKDVTVWLPFPEASFGVQKTLALYQSQTPWRVVHVATTRLAPWPCPDFATRRDALVTARRLSIECPSASHISLDGSGNVVGPITTLAAEFRASFDRDEAA